MIVFPTLAGLSSEPFSGDEAVNGVAADAVIFLRGDAVELAFTYLQTRDRS